ncbi:MAG: choice-of-anchor D domain-containing protein [Terracidiphilus sp.]
MTTNGSVSQGSFTASPSTVDFGSVTVGSSANNTVALVNSSSDPVVVSKLAVSGNSKFSLVDESQLPLTLAAGTTTTVKVHYGPTATEDDSGNLDITSNSMTVPKASIKLHGKGLSANAAGVVISALTCTDASITGVGTDACTVTISSAAPSGGFSIGVGSSNSVLTVPSSVTVPASATTVSFTATAAAVTTAQSVIITGSGGGSTKAFTVKLNPASSQPGSTSPTLAGLSCRSAAMSAAGTDACTVTLSAAAPAGGITVALASNNAAAKVPASVSVSANATSASFSTTVSAVTTVQSVALTATANSITKTFALQLNPASASSNGGTLSINATTIAFGNVLLSTPSTQSITLSATGSAVTVNGATASGTGFSVSGATFPMTVNPGASATINVAFDPTTAGAATGTLTIANNSTNNGSAAITLTGTGISHQIALAWNAPTEDTDPATGYKVYRATSGSSSYTLLNSSATAQTTYTDTSAQSGTTYQYYVTSVDSAGAESTPSNTATVVVP